MINSEFSRLPLCTASTSISVALFAAVILAAQGATYLTLKTEGPVQDRTVIWAKNLWTVSGVLFLAVSVESWVIRPELPGQARHNPFCWLGLLLAVVATILLISGISSRRELRAFVGSNGLLVGLLATGAGAIFPVMLNSTLAPENSLTAYAVAASPARSTSLPFGGRWVSC